MNRENEKIEEFLKSHMSRIPIQRSIFEDIMKNVTTESLYRNTNRRTMNPSHYKLIFYHFMKKILYIGIPVVVVALIAIIAVNHSNNSKVAYEDQNNGSVTTSGQTETFTKDSSIDSIAASFDADADADARKASSESEDGEALQSDLQDYNSIQNYDYQNNY